ncbi:unnamed protein product [Cuscuta campestris]|uniref:Uncharacterized protein n=1 Tax=Cuscuta campestris TaxID=132261 RepID=A0A484MU52_9ASTE|nr:unnamed protein product [Cuscuta campestris]
MTKTKSFSFEERKIRFKECRYQASNLVLETNSCAFLHFSKQNAAYEKVSYVMHVQSSSYASIKPHNSAHMHLMNTKSD